MSEEQGKECPCEMSLSEKQSVRSGSYVFSSVSIKSDQSKGEPPAFSEKKTSSTKSIQYETLGLGIQTHKNHFKENLLWIFQDLESKVIKFLKDELETFKKILQKENTQYFVKDFNENRCIISEAALDLTLYFLRSMKQDEAADTLEDELFFIHQLKCNLKKKYQCVFEGIAKQGDSILLNNIYTDLYITQGCSEQVNTEHEVRQIESFSRHNESHEIQVECKNLFEATEQDKEIRTVMTKGVAGIGKTICVQKFVLDWAEEKENKNISFIFPLPFREMNLKEKETQSLMGLLNEFFPETKGLNLTRKNKFKVLFILDGLDECRLPLNFDSNETWHDVSSPASLEVLLTNLIKGNLLPSALIWITTRPAAASKIPPDCIDRLTEIRGFNDAQKEEYFKKRLTDENLAKEIIGHIKQSKSLFIMCHIPVFCWISATVLQNILEEKRKNDLKNNQADGASKTLQESNTEDTPKTLTQMYTHFLRFQILQSRRKYDGKYTADVSWDKDAILSLGKLAFDQLERNNVIFYDTDLEACGIGICKASVYSGMCTQIFKKETEQENKDETMIDLLKTAVDKALESDNGHLDLFLRFLLGLLLQSNRQLLRGLLTQQGNNDKSKKEIVHYIKQKLEDNPSLERSINLFYCLNELNEQTLVKEIQIHLNKGSLSSADLSPAQWSALAFVLLTSDEEMEEFELQKFKKSDECLIRLSAIIKTSKRALLNECNLTEKSCSALAAVLGSDTNLKELNMNNNNLHDSGVKLLCTGLKNIQCELEILRLSNCGITEEGYKALASALRSNPSHLIELDLTGNDPGQSGVKQLDDLLQDPNCQLKTLRFLGPVAEEACQYVTGIVGKNLLLLRQLNLSESEIGDTRVNQIAALLQDKHCKLNTLTLRFCYLTDEGCSALTSALKSNPSQLRELDLSGNQLGDCGLKNICDLLMNPQCNLEKLELCGCSIKEKHCYLLSSALRLNPSHLRELDLSGNELKNTRVKHLCDALKDAHCKLERLRLRYCDMTHECCSALTSALKSNPSHLRELNLSGNKLGDSGVENLGDLLMNPQCNVEILDLCECSITEEQCLTLSSVLKSTHLRELDLSGNKMKNTGVNHLCDVLKDSHFKLERLRFRGCDLTDDGCSALTSALKSNPSDLRELDLCGNQLGESGVKNLRDLLMNPECNLEILALCGCSITEKQCLTLILGLCSNASHMRELDLSGNELKNTGVKHLCYLLKDSHCKLERLSLNDCAITDVACLAQSLAKTKAAEFLKELDLRNNNIGDSKQQLRDILRQSNCKLEVN
ncbi:NACHT, LRR and PYD domains-containing protein 3 isoform X2 [Carassius gibelio]|uniref:NACHT, LRR and PYD domains-containing protein 3 isoform X2 n=1 Tax=Carassius gibelio TaxID=101364 RepID=UPI0022777138|nr:NACHT, LRR and PYD domains-containing protein 3 isoform X2 [Carassius gibelio]